MPHLTRLLLLRRSAGIPLAGPALALMLAGCQPIASERVCTDELRTAFTPQERTLTVGESFSATVALSTCGGAVQLSDSFTWSATDSAIVMVDAPTGRVVARAAGQAYVIANGARYGRVGGIPVTVQPAAAHD